MHPEQKAVLRDAVIFAVKLWIDSLKDVVLAFMGLGAAVVDVIRTREGQKPVLFYRVMHVGERIDIALDLYGQKSRDAIDGPTYPL